MKQVILQRGAATVQEVPAPMAGPGTVLVAVERSCVSIGTELAGLRAGGEPLWRKALKRPEKVLEVARMIARDGPRRAKDAVEARLGAGQATGYSLAGVVVEVGPGIADLEAGQRVACAGAQCAHHAEFVCVPRNLAVPVPEGVDFDAASTVTLGAIALQGVRRASPTLGETFVVIGLGLIGQLTAQILRANGCRVIGSDLDASRRALALELGMDEAIAAGDEDDVRRALRLTDGVGADGVIITAQSASSEIVSTALRMCRRKGRVVVVGDVGLDIDRADVYAKELDLLVSCSYGPGRYDARYEEEGLDYPIGYVRWTESRNMEAYLRLLAEGRVRTAPLVSRVYGIEEAEQAYRDLETARPRPLCMLLRSHHEPGRGPAHVTLNPRVAPRAVAPPKRGAIGLAVVGAGDFARQVHLPNAVAIGSRVRLRAVCSRRGHNAADAAQRFGAEIATTDERAILDDPAVDAVLVATRHDLHAAMAMRALRAGKHVLVEKPLALTAEELAEIEEFFAERARAGETAPILLTGFNRRFSPYARTLAQLLAPRAEPAMLAYRMNAGHLPPDHWVHGLHGGGRNRGEACHVYDLFTALLDARVRDVRASAIRPRSGAARRDENFAATITFDDGSVASLLYTALGHACHPKEHLEAYADGAVAVLTDWRDLRVHGRRGLDRATRGPEKGHAEELAAFVDAIVSGGPWPIPLWQQLQATRIALEVERQITGAP
jgi:predicted dehydrogenase/threonine dehydrogenase-like Zn-dependent dehydrogenase